MDFKIVASQSVSSTLRDTDLAKTSSAAVFLGVDHLPFSVRKYPAGLAGDSVPSKRSFGEKFKDFFLSPNNHIHTQLPSSHSISNVEDLLKRYTPEAIGEDQGDEDYSSIIGQHSGAQDNTSFSSISNLSIATDLSMEQNPSHLGLSKPFSHGNFSSISVPNAVPSTINRSSSACETCQSHDSGFVDSSKERISDDKIKGLSDFFSKGLFSRLKPETSKPIKSSVVIPQCKKKSDEFMTKATQTWICDILPKWEINSRRWRQTHELWWLGLPPKIRGQVWKLSIGNDLDITEDLYKICLDRAACVFQHLDSESNNEQETSILSQFADKSGLCNAKNIPQAGISILPVADKPLVQSLPLILLDLSRTFPQLGLFQDGGPMNGALKNLLSAYTSYRPDVGYVQGMSFIASMLLLNMDEFDAFVAFTNLISRPLHLAMFSVDKGRIGAYVATFKKMFWSLMPELAGHFAAQRLTPDVYLFEWLVPIYCRSFSLDVVSRIWDVYLRDGENFLFKVALAILRQNEASLMASDFDQMVKILANVKAQADVTSGDQLFTNIHAVSKTKVSSSETFNKLMEESIAEDADRFCDS